MKTSAVCLLLFGSALFAQTADIGYFRAVMLPANEVPPTNIAATGVADIIAHVVRDSSGQITSGTVDFLVRANFPADATATGLHIHNGPAGQNAGVVINTGLSGSNSRTVKAGGDIVHLPAQVAGDNAAALAALRGLFQDPSQYYANIHTTDFPGGAIRGQLQRAQVNVFMGMMSSDNEVPPPTNTKASGAGQVVAVSTWNASGALTSAEVYLATSYTLQDPSPVTGFHIHTGGAGTNGAIVLPATLAQCQTADSSGVGYISQCNFEVPLTNQTQVNGFLGVLRNPGAYYINMHTSANAGGVMRAQLRPTDSMVFNVLMDSANEVAATSAKATAPAQVTVATLRNEDGSVLTGTVFFDANYRFPGPAQFTGLHIHDGAAGANGPVTVPMIATYDTPFASDSGFGNYFNWAPPVISTAGVATLNDLVKNPEKHYVNMHTQPDPGGAVRAQLGPPVTVPAGVAAVIQANLDKNATTVAPGGLISIWGTNLAKVATDLSGWAGKSIPESINGVTVDIGGKRARLLYVSSLQINAQVPVDLAPGAQTVVVNNGNGPSASFTVTVAANAPAIFFSPVPAVLKNSNFSLVSATNPVRADDVILVYCTGLGQTTPAVATGALAPAVGPFAATSTVTATMGGQSASVIYSIASPGFAGLYQVAIRVPAGLSGAAPLTIAQGATVSNSVSVAVQ